MIKTATTENKLMRRKALTLLLTMLMPLTIWAQTTDITSLSDITNMAGDYRLTADVSGAGHSTIAGPFTGTLEAAIDPATDMPYRITGLDAPLFEILTGTVRNLVLDGVAISGTTSATGATGAIACDATTATATPPSPAAARWAASWATIVPPPPHPASTPW